MYRKAFTPIGHSTLSPTDNIRRKEISVTPLKCWIEDFETEVTAPYVGRYSLRYDRHDKVSTSEQSSRFKIYVPLRSNKPITVEVRFKVESGIDINDGFKRMPIEAAMKMKPVVEAGIASWNNRFKLQISDPKCGKRVFPVKYTAVWVDSGEHYTLGVTKSIDRERVTQDAMRIATTTVAYTITHEFGHCLALPDEYSPTGEFAYIRFIRPDGSLDEKIATPDQKDHGEEHASFMSTRDNMEFYPRHAWNIAIEVQSLLNAKIGRKITCDILSA